MTVNIILHPTKTLSDSAKLVYPAYPAAAVDLNSNRHRLRLVDFVHQKPESKLARLAKASAASSLRRSSVSSEDSHLGDIDSSDTAGVVPGVPAL